jgi:hypothetical protein
MTEGVLGIELPSYHGLSWRDTYEYFSVNGVGKGLTSNDPNIVRISLMTGEVPNDETLQHASKQGNLEIFKLLLNAHKPIDIESPHGGTLYASLVDEAMSSGSIDMIEFVFSLYPEEEKTSNILNSLFNDGNKASILQYLLDNEFITYEEIADYLSEALFECTPHLQGDAFKYIIRNPEFMELADKYGILIMAIEAGEINVAMELVDNPSVELNNGDSHPLLLSIMNNQIDLVKKILSSDRLQVSHSELTGCLHEANKISKEMIEVIQNHFETL